MKGRPTRSGSTGVEEAPRRHIGMFLHVFVVRTIFTLTSPMTENWHERQAREHEGEVSILQGTMALRIVSGYRGQRKLLYLALFCVHRRCQFGDATRTFTPLPVCSE